MANFLVTGGAGFIGSHLVAHLLERGESVRVLDNFSTGKRENATAWNGKADIVEGDIRDFDTTRRAAEGMDYVMHQAAVPSVPRSVADPLGTSAVAVTGTLNMLEAARLAGVKRFVYAASSSAYGNAEAAVKSEDLPNRPLSPYASAKLSGELFLQAYSKSYGLSTMALRYFNIFGPRQDPFSPYSAVIPLFISAALGGTQPTVFGDGSQSRDFTYVENVVWANYLAATTDKGSGETVNIACGESVSLLQLLDEIGKLAGKKIAPNFAPPRTGDVMHSLAAIGKAKALIGYEPRVRFGEGLKRTFDFFRGAD